MTDPTHPSERIRTGNGRVLTDAEAAAHAAIVKRLSWPSMHWGAEELHPDALPHIAIAAAAAVREQVAAEIEAVRDVPFAMVHGRIAISTAARIARGQS